MRLLKPLLTAILFLCVLAGEVSAQSTRVRGRVLDSTNGNGIPYAGVFFKNSTVGVTCDDQGWFALETRVDTLSALTVSCPGYYPSEIRINPKNFNSVFFRLLPYEDVLPPSYVKADDGYVKLILERARGGKIRNNPERRDQYDCEIYSRNEFDLVNPDMVAKLLPKSFHFVYDYVDTSLVSGKPYLPVMIAESKSHYYHSREPELKKEVIESSRISGIQEEKTVAQFTGGLYIKANFYENYLNVFQVEIPSPLADNSSMFYDYFLVDSLSVDGRKNYRLRFLQSGHLLQRSMGRCLLMRMISRSSPSMRGSTAIPG